jgi:hypothetical protein
MRRFDAGEQAQPTQDATFKIKRLRITSQQNDFCGSIACHLPAIPRLQEVLDVEHSDTDAATRRSFKRMLFKKNFATDRANLDSI